MRSMTGFGRATCEIEGRRYVVELRSLNHRFLEVKQRLPWADPSLEQRVVQAIRARLERGVVSITVRDEGSGTGARGAQADLPLARSVFRALEEIRESLGLAEPVTLALVAAQPGVLSVGDRVADPEALWAGLQRGIDAALNALVEARRREGQALAADLRARVATLRRLGEELAAHAKEAPREAARRLHARVERLLSEAGEGVTLDPQRLALEVALLADKSDVSEELTRLAAHLDEVDALLAADGAIGRRLDFLAQELHREVNTIGSKTQAARVIDAKAEVERLREQVQNVE
jgi:uncharacterized protein (TIGR00255 family)